MAKKPWWPTSMPEQMMLVQNFSAKIGGYAAVLGLTPADIAAAQELCGGILGAYSLAESCRLTMQAMTQWRDSVFSGEPVGADAPAPPVFPVGGTPAYKSGSVKLFFAFRDRILSSPGYTAAIGGDLGLVGAEAGKVIMDLMVPELKATTTTGYRVNLSGSMQGMDALRVEYSHDGGASFQTVAFLTNTPGGFQISPQVANQPEKGVIRAVYIRKNEQVGSFSANYPVTLS